RAAGEDRRAGGSGRGPDGHDGPARAHSDLRGSGGVSPVICWWTPPPSITTSRPPFVTRPPHQDVPAAFEFFSPHRGTGTSLPSPSHSQNRRPERMHDAAVDGALDDWRSDLLK